jgi:TonB family protein
MASVQYKLAHSTRDAAERSNRLARAISLWKNVLDAEPRSAEAHTELARIAIEQVGWPIIMARTRSGMAIGEKGRVRDEALRGSLQEQYGNAIAEAILHARKALELNPTNVPAMRAMSGVLVMRANLSDSDAGFAADFKASEDWQQKAANATPKPAVVPGPVSNIGAVIGGMISQTPVPPGTTTMIFALPSAAERNLLTKIEPAYPDAARKAGVQGTVYFKAVIGTDGHVKTLDLVKGDPLLVKAAQDAVRKWVYRPFEADGMAREAVTDIAVPFSLEAGSPPQKNP